jgi:hypothetical protein
MLREGMDCTETMRYTIHRKEKGDIIEEEVFMLAWFEDEIMENFSFEILIPE